MKKQKKISIFIILGYIFHISDVVASSLVSGLFIEKKPEIRVDNFEEINLIYQKKIKSLDKITFQKINIILSQDYKGYFIINACQGKFHDRKKHDYNITIANPEQRTLAYIVAIRSQAECSKVFELQKFDVNFSEQGYIKGRSGENLCLSSTEIRKIHTDYYRAGSKNGMFTNLNPRTNLDVACFAPAGGDMEFTCFEYDKRHQQFRDIGGWKNQ